MPELEEMTVVQLRQYAADNKIELSSLSLPKAEIIEQITAAQQGTAAGAVQSASSEAPAPAKLDGPGGIEAVISANAANLLERPPLVDEEPKCDRCTQLFDTSALTTVSIDREALRVQRYCADCLEKVIASYGTRVTLSEA